MHCTKSLRSAFATIAATLLLAAGASGADTAPAKTDTTPAPAPSPTATVATVNGVAITQAELSRAEKVLLSQNRPMQQPMNAEMNKMLREAALNQLITKELLYQAGRKLEIKDLDKQVAERIAHSKGRFPSPEEYQKALKNADMTDKEVEALVKEDVIINNLIEKDIASKITISDAEVKKFYEENSDRFKRGETVKASHILVGVEPNATAEDKKKSKEKAEAILKQLKGGSDFAALAKKESSCPSKEQGGDLGAFGKGQMVPEFEKAAFALKPGELSPVVETQFGYHIIKLTEKHPEETVKLEEVKERITEFLKQQKVQQALAGYVDELKKKGKVEILAK